MTWFNFDGRNNIDIVDRYNPLTENFGAIRGADEIVVTKNPWFAEKFVNAERNRIEKGAWQVVAYHKDKPWKSRCIGTLTDEAAEAMDMHTKVYAYSGETVDGVRYDYGQYPCWTAQLSSNRTVIIHGWDDRKRGMRKEARKYFAAKARRA